MLYQGRIVDIDFCQEYILAQEQLQRSLFSVSNPWLWETVLVPHDDKDFDINSPTVDALHLTTVRAEPEMALEVEFLDRDHLPVKKGEAVHYVKTEMAEVPIRRFLEFGPAVLAEPVIDYALPTF